MSTDDIPFSVTQQKTSISAELQGTLLFQFLFGVYTGLFPITLYMYIHKESRTSSRDRIIIGNVTALYGATFLVLLSNWFNTDVVFCKAAATRLDIFIQDATGDMPAGERILGDVSSLVTFLFADTLLVWRCFHACGRSFRRSLLPMALLVVEIVMVLTAMVYTCLIDAKAGFETTQTDGISNRLIASALTSVAATSFVSTAVICLRIWTHTSPTSRSSTHYKTIINILIESSALYTITTLFLAILTFADTGSIESSFTALLITDYVDAVSQIITGLAPTLMIFLLVVSSSQEVNEVSSVQLPSDLISRASHATGAHMENTGACLEMQQNGSIRVEKHESEEFKDEPGNDHEIEDDAEARGKSLA